MSLDLLLHLYYTMVLGSPTTIGFTVQLSDGQVLFPGSRIWLDTVVETLEDIFIYNK